MDLLDEYIHMLEEYASIEKSDPHAALSLIASSLIAGEVDGMIISSRESGANFVKALMERAHGKGLEREIGGFALASYIDRFGDDEPSRFGDFSEFLEHVHL